MVPKDYEATRVVLTPSFAPYKIVLLALVAAYCAGILPKKTHRPLLATVVKYIEGPAGQLDTRTSVNIPTLDEILASIKESCLKADSVNGPEYAKDIELRLLHALWSLKALDSLHTFISRSNSIVVPNLKEGKKKMEQMEIEAAPHYLLTSSSFLGKFVSNCASAFIALEFDQTEQLWISFVNFRKSSKSSWVRNHSHQMLDVNDFFGTPTSGDDFSWLTPVFKALPLNEVNSKETIELVSQEDLTKLIDHQVHIFETYGTETSPELRNTLTLMTQAETGKIPAIHYISYLQCLRDADYEGAFNSLHRYFDYMMSNQRAVFYHYALLCLATLHAAFDCDGEAIRAIEEAISVARENKDFACLNFVLSWLFNFLKDRPELTHNFYVSSAQLLQFLKSNAGETSSSLHSTAYQSEAMQIMLEGGSISSALESLTKAAYISLNDDYTLVSFISYCALASALWFRVGNFELSQLYCDISLESSTSISQKISIMIRKASIEFSSGNIENAFKILEEQKVLVVSDLRLSKELVSHKLLLLSQQCIRSSRYKMAQYYLEKLKAQRHINVDIESGLHYWTAYLHLKLGDTHEAFQIVSKQISIFTKKSSNRYWYVKFTLLHCEIMGQSSAPARAVFAAIKCLQAASKSGYTLLVLESVLKLAEILKNLDQYDDMRVLLVNCLPYFEQSADLELKSKAHQLFADNLILTYDGKNATKEEKIIQITKIVEHLEKAIDGFRKISMFADIKSCLELQIKIGQNINHQQLLDHARASMSSINAKIQQELAVQS